MALFEVQPAHKIYAFERGWRIMGYVTNHLFQRTNLAARWWFTKAQDAQIRNASKGAFVKYCVYVYMAGMYLAGAAQYLSAITLAALFLALQFIVLVLWAFVSLCMIGLLTVGTFAYSRFYRIFFRCPDCHKQMEIPTFICPTCHEKHTRLWPSIYGVFSHRCLRCETRLPTLGLKIAALHVPERSTLTRVCPHCNREMNPAIGGSTNIHIPVVGGPSTGKSNFLVMATREFKETYEKRHHYSVTFADKRHEQDYQENINRLTQGRPVVKTTEIVARAYNLLIRAPRSSVSKLAYIYDAAGEAYNTSENTTQQEYYKYIDGIVFIIDPFSISAYRHAHEAEVLSQKNLIRPGDLDVMSAYERMFTMFEDSIGLKKRRQFSHPIAIVVTKVDASHLEAEIGTFAAQQLMRADASIKREEDAIHTLVREFLCRYGLSHFVQNIEMQFSNVRYFSCSALGRLPTPGDTRAFVPLRVGDPLIWLLAKVKAIEPPEKLANGRATQVLEPMTIQLRQK